MKVVQLERPLTAIPLGWVSWNFELREEDATVCTIETSWWGESGTLAIGEKTWQLGREGWMYGEYSLKQNGVAVAKAEKPSVFFRSFQITFDHEYFTWQAESPLWRAFVLRKGNEVIGSMRPENAFTRRASIDLPKEVSLERKAFLVWLALLMWRRQQNSN